MSNRLIKKISFGLLAITVVAIYPVQVMAASSAVSPSSVTVGIGQTTSVNIVANSGSDSNAADVVVSYNSTIIEPVSITAGPGVSALGSGTTSPNFAITVFKGGGNFSNGEVLAVVTFKGRALGSTTLSTSGTDIQPGGNTSPSSGTVIVTSGYLPDSGLFDNPGALIAILGGLGVISFGSYLGWYSYKQRRQNSGNN